jgi:hypothetical protein
MYDSCRKMQNNMTNHSNSQPMLFTIGTKMGITTKKMPIQSMNIPIKINSSMRTNRPVGQNPHLEACLRFTCRKNTSFQLFELNQLMCHSSRSIVCIFNTVLNEQSN